MIGSSFQKEFGGRSLFSDQQRIGHVGKENEPHYLQRSYIREYSLTFIDFQ